MIEIHQTSGLDVWTILMGQDGNGDCHDEHPYFQMYSLDIVNVWCLLEVVMTTN